MTAADDDLRRRISEGVLAFPVTPFDAAGAFDEAVFARHVDHLAGFGPVAMVAAGGAGELFSLTLEEHSAVLRTAVAHSGKVPVLAGAGQGVALAIAMAKTAERLGAAAVLLFPPYLIVAEQEGLFAYVREVCRAVGIGVIVYSRNNGILTADTVLRLADACPNMIALKDGTGDFESLVTLRQRAGDRLAVINGVPTAEIIAQQCLAVGIRSYTSAVFSFLPALAMRYWQALAEGDRVTLDRMLSRFYVPLVALRSRKRGYAVSLVKAGLKIVGKPAGRLRPPLVELTAADEAELAALIAAADDLLAETAKPVAALAMR